MKKIQMLICALAIYSSLQAQVGININTPRSNSALHIHSNQSSPNGYENDLIIDTANGNVGLGTATPVAKVDINGNFRFTDKTSIDFLNKLLAADSEGNVSWKYFNEPFPSKVVSWSMQNDHYPNITSANNIITLGETTHFSSNIQGASVVNDILTLPQGRYYITLSAGVANSTNKSIYQTIKLLNGQNILLETYYFNLAMGLALFVDAKEEQHLSLELAVLDVKSNPDEYLPFADAFPIVGPNKIGARFNVLTITVSAQ